MKPAKQLPTFSASEEFERQYVRPKPGRALVVGSYITKGKPDRRELYSDALGVDMRNGPGVDRVLDLECLDVSTGLSLGCFSHIECLSVLEHSRRPWMLAANLERLMLAGSTLHIAVPFVWAVHDYPADYWRFSVEGVRVLFPRIDWHKLTYGNTKLDADVRAQKMKDADGFNFFPRTEVLGWGVKA